MSARSEVPADLPPLSELGYDLLVTTPGQRVRSLLRPFVCAAAYAVFDSAVRAVLPDFSSIENVERGESGTVR